MKNPKIVTETIIDNDGTKTETNNVNIYPVTITRYAYLEMIDSPFVNPEKKFGVSTIIPTAFVFCNTPEVLRKYGSKDAEKLIADSYTWADKTLKMEDIPELIKAITDRMIALNKAAPSGGTSATEDSVGGKKK